MSKKKWKLISWLFACLLTALVALFGVPFSSNGLLAQESLCGLNSTEWSFEAIKSMVERYGVAQKFACSGGSFQSDNPDVRADIAEWMAIGFKYNEKQLQDNIKVISEDIEKLQQLYEEIDKKITIHQETHRKVPVRGLW
jgi:hypothetical protein